MSLIEVSIVFNKETMMPQQEKRKRGHMLVLKRKHTLRLVYRACTWYTDRFLEKGCVQADVQNSFRII